ncbi:MAG: zinc ribbon domain-containing protein [Dehalococcoidia bacterium]|nr:zinc ribbon domain-containing protein [Dehalococcoidia bacterium]
MPTYEFRCLACQRRFGVFTRQIGPPTAATCVRCGSAVTRRVFSSFAVHRTEADRLAALDDRAPDADFYRDSRNIGLTTKKRLQELGATDLMPQIDSIIERGRSGELLKEYIDSAESRGS